MQYTLSDREFLFISQMIYRINTLEDYESVARTTLEQLKLIIPFSKGILYQMRSGGTASGIQPSRGAQPTRGAL